MALIHQVLVEVFHVVQRSTQTTTTEPPRIPVNILSTTISPSATATTSSATMSSTSSTSSGPTSSPLLFFVALGFGVVFTNLWIIVGVKYCFRYNARNRAIRNGEELDPINLEIMPTRPHRRRREKKLMTMDEVNERFPLTKYKAWVSARAMEGLPTAGGVTAPSSRAGSLRDVDGVMPSSPVDTKHSVHTRPASAVSEAVDGSPAIVGGEQESVDTAAVEENNKLEEVQTTATTVHKHATSEEDEDDDDHIHTAVPPELLTNPGDSCAICIDTLEEDDDIRGLTCGHAFHAGCLDPWLTSRRACCPLCKADYYVPKPRPEGEPAENDRSGRRREGRTTQQPQLGWTTIRGSPRSIFPARFVLSNEAHGNQRSRRGRRQAPPASDAAVEAVAAESTNPAAPPRRWRPRITNPFNSLRMPTIPIPGRAPQGANSTEQTVAPQPSPSQLEAGTVP